MWAVLCVCALSACNSETNRSIPNSPSPSSTPSTPGNPPPAIASTSPESVAFKVERFTLDELDKQGGGGCGMTLWKQTDGPRPPGYLFYNRMAQKAGDEFALMKINGSFVRFRRTTATGQEFYGQRTSQTFVSQDKATLLQVDVKLGKPGEIESISTTGTLQVQHRGESWKMPIRGDAGC